jgi:membrane protein
MKTFVWSWRLMCRWLVEAYLDNTTGLAAMMAYDFIFLLAAPGLLLFSAMLSIVGTDPALLHNIIVILEGFMPKISRPIIERQVVALVISGANNKVALFGIPLAIYLGINLINTISRTLNHCLGVKDPQRSWWNRWIIAVFLLFWFAVTSLFSFNAIVFGERLAAALEATFHLNIPLQALVAWFKYPIIALALVVLALALYLLTPEVYQTIRQALPGAFFFSFGWLGATGLFSVYVQHSRYSESYQTMADLIVLLTWTWLTCLLLLLGGRLNAVIVRKWPTRPGARRHKALTGGGKHDDEEEGLVLTGKPKPIDSVTGMPAPELPPAVSGPLAGPTPPGSSGSVSLPAV